MMLKERIEAFIQLGLGLMQEDAPELTSMLEEAEAYNPWFSRDNILTSIAAIRDQMLDAHLLQQWLSEYHLIDIKPKKVGLILAGNIPAVGFHDVLCTLVSGHNALIKLSDKDKIIIPFLLKHLVQIQPVFARQFEYVDQLKNMDAVIATGSDNTGIYFINYFGKYPNIIRKHRNSIAVLDGNEDTETLKQLGKDIFQYFGLGCRNVSKIYIPADYNIDNLLEVLHEYNAIIHHHKYKNNFDYNLAVFLLNRVKYKNNGCLMMIEDERLTSRIASVHYEYYENEVDLTEKLNNIIDKVQCIASNKPLPGFATVALGETQRPGLNDYADGIDTLAFLTALQ